MVELKIIDERKYDETIAKGAPAARETFCERFWKGLLSRDN